MIIGITGLKGSGKDTAAQYFVDKYGFTRIGYADSLKEAIAALFDVPVSWLEKHKSDPRAQVAITRIYDSEQMPGCIEHASVMNLRTFMQRFGTEMGREVFGQDFWVEQLKRKMGKGVFLTSKYVISDVRFNNEAPICDYIIEIIRPDRPKNPHVSELGLDEALISHVVINNGTIDELNKRLEACLQEMLSSRV